MKRQLALLMLATCVGCAAALKAPPALQVLAGHPAPRSAPEIDALRSRAEMLFKTRQLGQAREAARLWLEVAAAVPASNGSIHVTALAAAARTWVWLAEHEDSATARRQAARTGVYAAQWCTHAAPVSAACNFWLGAALGVQARERPSTGLSGLPAIVTAFEQAARTEPDLDDGAPSRALALLYLRAPGWPTGPGDVELGLQHAHDAIRISPSHPANWLALGEARREAGEHVASREAYERARELARERVAAGDPDAAAWVTAADEALAR